VQKEGMWKLDEHWNFDEEKRDPSVLNVN